MSEHMEDAGNWRQSIHQEWNLHPLSDSLYSEQQKLRVVLDWAHSFLSSTSEVNSESCRADDAATRLIKAGVSCWSDARKDSAGAVSTSKMCNSDSTDGIHDRARSKRELTGNQKALEEMEVEEERTEDGSMEESIGKLGKECSSAFIVYTNDNVSYSEPQKIGKQMAENAKSSCSYHLKIPSNVTVYEQYQLCVDQLQQLRQRQRSEKERKPSEETAAPAEAPVPPTSFFERSSPKTNPEINKCLNKVQNKRLSTADITAERASDTINENRERRRKAEHEDNLNMNETFEDRSLCQRNHGTVHVDLNGKNDSLMKRTAKAITSNDEVISTHTDQMWAAPADVEDGAASAANPGTKHQSQSQSRLCEKSHWTNAGLSRRQQMNRPQSAGGTKSTKRENTQTKRRTLEDRQARVPVCDWLLMPDEVWLSILSLLPHSDLCAVMQVCSRLHTLATDYTLWKSLRVENSTVTEQWFLSVGQRRPRSLCLYSCSSRSVTSCGLEMFFTSCNNTLEEISVTGCVGPGLHGDQILALVGQLCDRVTTVDVSWSGATDTGVGALSDGCSGLRLKSVVLNGCHVTDDPLKKLAMRHKQSLCRLEVFGCQFLTPTCLQTIYEMCPGLQHLNIGQVPKVNTLSLTVMTSHLKGLISLNLTGLKAVTDATVDALLQVCVELQSLTLSSCPGVSDLTLHNISKYTPCIRYRHMQSLFSKRCFLTLVQISCSRLLAVSLCVFVRALDVSGCKTITDSGVRFLTLGCKRLEQLDLSSTGTGNRGVALLANYCSRHLHTVKLSFCHISSENILKLCRRCKSLTVLHLYGCARLPTENEIREVNATVKVHPLS
ncbi:lysine-specific demethylase 2B-like [Anabas testudineus]|uniref:lysine-specific demethylase 2B-like n=1 Tax=Anabas testudineus TaxID=64144 RepID=UPI000E454436|nr:lysine-specific demethylase 2B-like [Anabas testudineus]